MPCRIDTASSVTVGVHTTTSRTRFALAAIACEHLRPVGVIHEPLVGVLDLQVGNANDLLHLIDAHAVSTSPHIAAANAANQ
jgi:hypothetical protein